MVVSAVDEALAVVLVVEPAGDARDRGSPELLPVFRRAGIVHHRLGITDNYADEGEVASVGRPDRAACVVGHEGDLARVAWTGSRDHEDMVRWAAAAHTRDRTCVRRPYAPRIATGGLVRI